MQSAPSTWTVSLCINILYKSYICFHLTYHCTTNLQFNLLGRLHKLNYENIFISGERIIITVLQKFCEKACATLMKYDRLVKSRLK